MSKLKNEKLNDLDKKFFCNICLSEVPFSETLELSCLHRYCLECLTIQWTNLITIGHISEKNLKCPLESCSQPISYYELKSNLNEKLFQKYEDFSLKFIISNNEKEKVVTCPNPKCEKKIYYIYSEADYFTCKECKNKYCAKCYGIYPDHEEMTCENFKNLKLTPEEKAFRNEIRNKGLMDCPFCGSYVEKTAACNSIRCKSAKCQGKKVFCYLCGTGLNEELDHFNHFERNNPYNMMCNGLKQNKKLLEEKIKRGLLDEDEEIDEVENLKKKCPKCGENNPKIFEYIDNFLNNTGLGNCSSNVCKGKKYCLKCYGEIKEEKLIEHFKLPDCTKKNSIDNCLIF